MTADLRAVMWKRREDLATSNRSIHYHGPNMRLTRPATGLLLAAIAFVVHAEAPKTREQVKAELKEAVRTGDVYAGGDSGLRLNELYPQRYPRIVPESAKTRAEVQAELAAAMREGTIVPAGEGGMSLRNLFPQRYPAVAVAPGRTREQVVAETREAIRNGDMYAAGEGVMKLNEEFPGRYARQRATYTAQLQRTDVAASAAAR
jgi:hypothetical protein